MFPFVSIAWLFVFAARVAQAQQDGDDSTANVTCVEWEKGTVAFEEAFAQWQAVDCFTFTYTDLASYSDGQSVSRTVRYGTKIGPADYQMYPTFPDLLYSVLINCFDECPS